MVKVCQQAENTKVQVHLSCFIPAANPVQISRLVSYPDYFAAGAKNAVWKRDYLKATLYPTNQPGAKAKTLGEDDATYATYCSGAGGNFNADHVARAN